MISEDMLGLFKVKGGVITLHPGRFYQMENKRLIPYEVLKKRVLGYAIIEDKFWLICKEGDDKYIRVPFARNKIWFDAITSEPEFASIAKLPQIYITGVG